MFYNGLAYHHKDFMIFKTRHTANNKMAVPTAHQKNGASKTGVPKLTYYGQHRLYKMDAGTSHDEPHLNSTTKREENQSRYTCCDKERSTKWVLQKGDGPNPPIPRRDSDVEEIGSGVISPFS